MTSLGGKILTVNGGSSSVRFAVYGTDSARGASLVRRAGGIVERIGLNGTTLSFDDSASGARGQRQLTRGDHRSAVDALLDWLGPQVELASLEAVGHRIVH